MPRRKRTDNVSAMDRAEVLVELIHNIDAAMDLLLVSRHCMQSQLSRLAETNEIDGELQEYFRMRVQRAWTKIRHALDVMRTHRAKFEPRLVEALVDPNVVVIVHAECG